MKLAAVAAIFLIAGIAHAAPFGGQGGPGRGLRGFDANNDGQITREEARSARARQFERMDADADGFVTQAEIDAARAAAQAQAPEGGRGGRGGGRDAPRLAQWDADGDGKVSRTEFVDAPQPMFDRLDANKNGVIEASEMPRRGR